MNTNIRDTPFRERRSFDGKFYVVSIQKDDLGDAYTIQKKAFGATVRLERKRQKLSQESLAERAALHRTYITDIERGARNPSLETICKLAYALKVPIVSLFSNLERTRAGV